MAPRRRCGARRSADAPATVGGRSRVTMRTKASRAIDARDALFAGSLYDQYGRAL
jgi:hypothetical protein